MGDCGPGEERYVGNRYFVVATNDDELAAEFHRNAKAIAMMERRLRFTDLSELNLSPRRHTLVLRDWLELGLGHRVLVDTTDDS